MVFSSTSSIYLDHPTNWQQLQQSNPHQGSALQNSQHLELSALPPPPLQVGSGGGGVGGLVRPGSMVDRARVAKVPQPEAGLKCPRCDSTNTKFCYFNNYSLTQPRHFCKTCRRYWTRGGALRNVPVGGGCRRNKRSKNPTTTTISSCNTSRSQVLTTSQDHQRQTCPNKSANGSPTSCSTDISGHFTQLPPQLPFMAALQNLSHYNLGGTIGANYIAGFQSQGFQNIGSGNNGLFPFLANFETPANLFPLQNHISGSGNQGAQVKMEESRGVDLSKQFMGVSENNQYWGGISTNSWADHYSGINSSSAANLV